MKILSIETSCDETAVSLIEATGTLLKPTFKLLGNSLYSQVALHAEFGGVLPNLAKREHGKNLVPLLLQTLTEAKFLVPNKKANSSFNTKAIEKILAREPELLTLFLEHIPNFSMPKIDAVAVTAGPGLEPALWVGISFAEALGKAWNIPVVPINHMEGHIVSTLFQNNTNKQATKSSFQFPILALLISGGHTELVFSDKPLSYKKIGATRDDALGECYDKVARMMKLPYPGGPEVSKLAKAARESGYAKVKWNLPRPMIYTKDFDFSFSGLKTAVLYKIRDHGTLTAKDKRELSKEFEDAVTDVLMSKTRKAIADYKPKNLVIAGGVIANPFIREAFKELAEEETISLSIPQTELATDNAVMIGMAGFLRIRSKPSILSSKKHIVARGNDMLF